MCRRISVRVNEVKLVHKITSQLTRQAQHSKITQSVKSIPKNLSIHIFCYEICMCTKAEIMKPLEFRLAFSNDNQQNDYDCFL